MITIQVIDARKSALLATGHPHAKLVRKMLKYSKLNEACKRELGKEIRHADRCREYRAPEGIQVDGYYEDQCNRYILQLHGCF